MVFPRMAHALSAGVQGGKVAWSELLSLSFDSWAKNDAGII